MTRRLLAVLLAAVAPLGCGDGATTVPVPVAGEPGEPLPDLSAQAMARFEAGRALFRHAYTEEEGLGPRFNENACNACHTVPSDGGTGETLVRRASRTRADGTCDGLGVEGGANLRLRATAALTAAGGGRVAMPADADHSASFTIPFLYGMGLVDAVPQSVLDSLADPDDADGNGISGRVGHDAAGHPARFGRKADVATLADFVDSAFRMEMGITTPRYPMESMAGSIPAVPEGVDPAPEPEVDSASFQAVTDYVRMLAPTASKVPSDDAERASMDQGRTLFSSLGCVGCHVPVMVAGPSPVPGIEGRAVALYSDLLLHDMGPELEGPCAPGATTTEYRTEPLMGLRYRRTFLHDGRAGRIMDAVLAHGGEARTARDAFASLDRVTQEVLLLWLQTR